MNKMKAVALLSVFLFSLGAFAFQAAGSGQDSNQGQGQGQGQGRGQMMSVDDQVKILTERLNLSTDQQTKIKAILDDNRQQMDTLRKDESMSREDKMSKARALRETTQGKIREVLNDDQKKKYDEMQQEMRDRQRQRQGGDSNPPKQ